MADRAKTKQITDNTNLTFDAIAVYSHTTGEIGGKYNKDGITVSTQNEKTSYETLMARSFVGAETKLFDNGNTQVSNIAGTSAQGYYVLGHSNHYSCSKDARITLEGGVKITNGKLTGNASGAVVIDTYHDNNGERPTLGSKVNLGLDYTLNPSDNLSLNMQAKGYGVFTGASTDVGVQTNFGATWKNPNQNGKIGSVWTNIGTGSTTQNLKLGGFHENTENNFVFSAQAGMNIGQNTNLNLNYTQYNNDLNNSKNYKQIMATLGIRF